MEPEKYPLGKGGNIYKKSPDFWGTSSRRLVGLGCGFFAADFLDPLKRHSENNWRSMKELLSLKLTWTLKIGLPNRKVVFQPSICRGENVSFREGKH